MKRTNRTIGDIPLLFFMLFVGCIYGQQGDYNNIVPASPTAQTFQRYGEIPVDYSTGVPNINIPIYTLEGSKLSIPISISYHASGIKVNDIASEVGLGWALNAGGIISRTINGTRDEKGATTKTYGTAAIMRAALEDVAYDWNSSTGEMEGINDFEYFFDNNFVNEDPMSDRYFYRLPNGSSGVFMYKDAGFTDVVMMPLRPYKVSRQVSGSGGTQKIDWFEILDDNGIKYRFEPYGSSIRSEWVLKQLTSADGKDVITYTYGTPVNYSFTMESNTFNGRVENWNDPNCQHPSPSAYVQFSPVPSQDFGTPLITSIQSSKAKVVFTYASRSDFSQLKRLDKITISPINEPSNIIKRFDFEEKYFGTTAENKRLGLDKVVVTNNAYTSDPQNQEYSFVYESQVLPGYPTKMSSPTFSEDYWGYYSGITSGNLIPKDFITYSADKSLGGNRNPGSDYYAKACMLKEIKYPTGGRTVFEFERNQSSNNVYLYTDYGSNDGPVGGFRVKSITNYTDATTVANVKTYQYANPVARQIRAEYFMYDQFYVQNFTCQGLTASKLFSRKLISSNPLLPLEVAPGLPIMYKTVTEYNGTLSNHAGKTVYTYDNPYSPNDYESNPDHPIEYEYPVLYQAFHYDKGNYVPEMLSKSTYAYNGSTYSILTKEEYDYTKLYTSSFNTGIKLTKLNNYPPDYFYFSCFAAGYSNSSPLCASAIAAIANEYLSRVIMIDTKAYQEASLLTNSKSYVYDPSDSSKYMLTSTDYTYNSSNVAVSEQTTTNSKGETLKTTFKYPHDYPSTQPYQTMIGSSKNILSPIIEQSTYKGTTFLSKSKTTYKDWTSGVIAPEYIQQQKGSGPLENKVKLEYDSYTGDLLSYEQVDGTEVVYLWGYYNREYPVAKVENSNLSSVLATLTSTELTNIRNGSYDQSTMISKLDKIRTGLPNALVTTYTYDPLVGVTSMTDPKGYTVYYEYDAFNRLRFVRDSNGYIVNQNEYHYKE